MASSLRWAYQRRILRPAGRTRDGALRLRGPSIFGGPCGHTEVDLDPKTFVPRRLESVSTEGGAQQGRKSCGSGGQATREVWTIESVRYLPATAENRRLLRIGDWPVARAERWAGTDERGLPKYEPLKRVPPVPPLDEG
jgi:hypothetical protein